MRNRCHVSFCALYSALDARREGFAVAVLTDAAQAPQDSACYPSAAVPTVGLPGHGVALYRTPAPTRTEKTLLRSARSAFRNIPLLLAVPCASTIASGAFFRLLGATQASAYFRYATRLPTRLVNSPFVIDLYGMNPVFLAKGESERPPVHEG